MPCTFHCGGVDPGTIAVKGAPVIPALGMLIVPPSVELPGGVCCVLLAPTDTVGQRPASAWPTWARAIATASAACRTVRFCSSARRTASSSVSGAPAPTDGTGGTGGIWSGAAGAAGCTGAGGTGGRVGCVCAAAVSGRSAVAASVMNATDRTSRTGISVPPLERFGCGGRRRGADREAPQNQRRHLAQVLLIVVPDTGEAEHVLRHDVAHDHAETDRRGDLGINRTEGAVGDARLEIRPEPLHKRFVQPPEKLPPDVFVQVGLMHDEPDERRVPRQRLDPRANEGEHKRFVVAGRELFGRGRRAVVRDHTDDAAQDVLLAREVEIYRALGQTRGRGDLADRRAVESAAAEHLQRGAQDLRAPLTGAGFARGCAQTGHRFGYASRQYSEER